MHTAAMPFQLPSYKISIKLVQLALEKCNKEHCSVTSNQGQIASLMLW